MCYEREEVCPCCDSLVSYIDNITGLCDDCQAVRDQEYNKIESEEN